MGCADEFFALVDGPMLPYPVEDLQTLGSIEYHPPLKMYFRGGRGQVKKIHLPFSKNLIPQDPP